MGDGENFQTKKLKLPRSVLNIRFNFSKPLNWRF
jgi:hypothetical protein